MMQGDPKSNLAAVGLIRAAITDDADAGILILDQNGAIGQGDGRTEFLLGLTAVAARALMSGYGYNVERVLKVLDTWAAEYADEARVS